MLTTLRQINHQISDRLKTIAITVLASLVLLVGIASPALAFGGSSSSATEGTAQMNNLQNTSERALKAEPRGASQVQKQAQSGPNAVQGDADLHAMNKPSTTTATQTVQDQIEQVLEKITP